MSGSIPKRARLLEALIELGPQEGVRRGKWVKAISVLLDIDKATVSRAAKGQGK